MPENSLKLDAVRDPLTEARRLLDESVPRASPVLKALLASALFAVSGLWLGASSMIGPVLGHDRPAQATQIVTRSVQPGSEGGFQLSSSPDGLGSGSAKAGH